jgi:hypothetical protein
MIASNTVKRAAVPPVDTARRPLQRFKRVAWLRPTVVGALGLLGFALASAADGRLARLTETDTWRDLSAPVLITYLVAVQPLLAGGRQDVAAAFGRALPAGSTDRLKVEVRSPWSRGALLAICAAVAVVVLEDGWFRWPMFDSWLNGYYYLLRLVLFGLIGWTSYRAWELTRLGIRLQRHVGTLDLFNLDFPDAIGRQSTSVLLLFVGGISLSLLFVPVRSMSDP